MAACPACGHGPMRPFLALDALPVFCNVLWPTRAQALAAPRGDIRLAFCDACTMIRNVAFDPELVRYGPRYENSLHFSPAFQAFARALANRLIERYDLRGKDVVDIGCGRGDFLAMLCEGTGNRGVGYDPGAPVESRGGNPVLVRGVYAGEPADFIVCRHVLEHLADPHALVASLASEATTYFEVPDGGYMLREVAIWDVIYEHASYFTAPALERLFAVRGLGALDLGSAFCGQYLWIEAGRQAARPRERRAADDLPRLADAFGAACTRKVAAWSARLRELRAAGRTVALWGAGSKGVTFLNAVDGGEAVEHVIDLNVRKHGRHVPGTGQEISGPESAGETRPDVVLAMNRLYADEIRSRLAAEGVPAEVLAV